MAVQTFCKEYRNSSLATRKRIASDLHLPISSKGTVLEDRFINMFLLVNQKKKRKRYMYIHRSSVAVAVATVAS